MPIQRFARDQLTPTPWKNGGGITHEIVSQPPGPGFDWRISIATIAADGPFSTFPGIDRHILLLDAPADAPLHTVHLRSDDGAIDHALDTPLTPFAFPGEARIDGTLPRGGPSQDFNVMTRRDTLRAEVSVLHAATTLPACSAGLLFAARGDWQIEAVTAPETGMSATSLSDPHLPATHGLWWTNTALSWRLAPRSPNAALIQVLLWPTRP